MQCHNKGKFILGSHFLNLYRSNASLSKPHISVSKYNATIECSVSKQSTLLIFIAQNQGGIHLRQGTF